MGNGGFQYFFININDEADDPIVYSIDSLTNFDQPAKPRLFSQLIIYSYNEMVAYKKKAEDPWIDDPRRTGVIEWIEESFPFKNTSNFATKTNKYVRYTIKHTDEENCLKYFTPILNEMLTEINSVFVYIDKKLYVYVPKKDKTMDKRP